MIQILTWFFSPYSLCMISLAIGLACSKRISSKKLTVLGRRLELYGFVGLLLLSQPLLVNLFGTLLEMPFPYVPVEKQPVCDVIVLLGGGMAAPKRENDLPEMFGAADRVWHASRLWHAGKAKYIIASGSAENNSSAILLKDLGVPESALVIEGEAVNTIGNGIYTRKLMDRMKLGKRILLVTSASHMRRSIMIFEAVGLTPVPAAVDHEATHGGWLRLRDTGLSIRHILPSPSALSASHRYYKEYLGLFGDWIRIKIAARKAGIT